MHFSVNVGVSSNDILKISENKCCWYWDHILEIGSLWEKKKKLDQMQTEVGP